MLQFDLIIYLFILNPGKLDNFMTFSSENHCFHHLVYELFCKCRIQAHDYFY